MTNLSEPTQVHSSPLSILHPLEPLTPEEIAHAVQIVRTERHLSERVRFVSVNLNEPPKDVVLNFQVGDPVGREAFMILLDNGDGKAYEAVVSLSEGRVVTWRHVPNVQPPSAPSRI